MGRCQISVAQLQALRIIETRIAPLDCLWVITGSLAFAVQGLDFLPGDIDLQTDRNGAFQIEAALSDFMIRPVRFQQTEKISSHFGSPVVHSVQVEIMGDLQKRGPAGDWGEPPDLFRHRRWVDFDGIRLPVLSLTYEYSAYLMLGRTGTASKIKAGLDCH
jgi:hypothetical protein